MNQQIVYAFEELKLTPAQIAEQFDKEELAIKAVLMSSSRIYRNMTDAGLDYSFKDNEALEAKTAVIRLLRNSEDEHLVFKISRYILDDKKGRLDIGKALGNVKMDVTVFNQYLIEAKQSIEKSTGGSRPPAPLELQKELIDV